MHRFFQPALALVVSASLAGAPLAEVLHEVATPHAWCEVHQHMVHADRSAASPRPAGVSPRAQGSTPDEHGCPVAAGQVLETVGRSTSTAHRTGPDRTPAAWDAPAQTSVLARAPKHGPPAAV